jgi:hypothetical protein
MHTTLNKQTSFFVVLSLILVLFSTCRKGSSKYKNSNTPTIQWQKTIGNNDTVTIDNVQKTTDGGYILAGYKVTSPNNYDYWIVKLNSNADIEWEKTYGGSNTNKATYIQQTADGGYIVAGYSYSTNGDVTNNNGGIDAWILKLSTNGDIEWQKTYGGSADDYFKSIKQTTDNGYITVGHTYSKDGDIPNNQGNFDAWIIKIDVNENLEWSKTFGGTDYEQINNVQQTTNGEYLILGQTESINGDITNNHGNADWWIIKLQTNGNLQWQKTYGGSGFDVASCIQKTNDGHYIVAGITDSNDGDITNSHGDKDAWVVKIDDLGTILQQTTIGTNGSEGVNSILQTHDNNFLVVGSSQNANSNIKNIFVAALNTNCTLLWQRQIPQENSDTFARAIFETTDCGYIIFGKQFFSSSSGNDIIIKLK